MLGGEGQNYICLDTTNNDWRFWLYDTEPGELVKLDLRRRRRDLPEGEREPFRRFCYGKTAPMFEGQPMEDQDGYWPTDYRDWIRRGRPGLGSKGLICECGFEFCFERWRNFDMRLRVDDGKKNYCLS